MMTDDELHRLAHKHSNATDAMRELSNPLYATIDELRAENAVLREQNFSMNKRIVGLASPATVADFPDVVLPEFDSLVADPAPAEQPASGAPHIKPGCVNHDCDECIRMAQTLQSLCDQISSANARADALQAELKELGVEYDESVEAFKLSQEKLAAAKAERDAAVADAKLGRILMRYIDRLNDITDEDTAQKIIGKMSAEVDLVVSARHATERNP